MLLETERFVATGGVTPPMFTAMTKSAVNVGLPSPTATRSDRTACGKFSTARSRSSCSFDTIPHADLMKTLARRISDRRMLRLLEMWHFRADALPQGWPLVPGGRACQDGGHLGTPAHAGV